MAIIPNTTVSTDAFVAALDREFIANFEHDAERLQEILEIVSPEVVKAGTTLYQYTVSGSLNNSATSASTPVTISYEKTTDEALVGGKTYYTRSGSGTAESPYTYAAVAATSLDVSNIGSYYERVETLGAPVLGASSGTAYVEGDEVALSKYTMSRTPVGVADFVPYRKLTTGQTILKYGFENAMTRTDEKMLRDIRKAIWTKFFTFLGNGTGTVKSGQSVATLQATLANVEASLEDIVETAGDELSGRVIHFVNRFDVADYLAGATITTQEVFGMTYLENFLGVKDVFVGGQVSKGTVIATPVENIHLYGIDFSALSRGGLSYTTSDSGLIGVHHSAAYNRVSCETNVLSGAALMAEATNFIVKATITPQV